MKRFFLMLAFAAVVGGVSAQEPVKTLSDAQTEYDQAVIEQKRAVSEARNLERRISDAASHRLETVKADYQGVKERYKIVVAEQKRLVAEAKSNVDATKVRYKEESARTKEEIAAAKARTKSVVERHKGSVAKAKSEIARIKAEQHAK